MNMYAEVLDKIKSIEKVSGDAKKMLFVQYIKDDAFATIARMILDPYRMFGVREVRHVNEPTGEVISLSEFKEAMMWLETRQVSGTKAHVLLARLVGQHVPEELLNRILKKDMRCGIGPDTANKVSKNFVPSFKVALAKEYEEGDTPLPAFVSPKFDGMRCMVMVDGENVQFLSRNGLAFPALSDFAQKFLDLGQDFMVYDCEVLVGNHFNETGAVKGKKAKANNAVFQVFDMLPLCEFIDRMTETPQEIRLMRLADLLSDRDSKDPIQFCPHPMAYTDQEVAAAFKKYRKLGLEGVIVKQPKATYQFKRSNAWTKIKDFVTYDLQIVDVIEGEGKFVGTLGAIVVMFRGNRVKIGTGFSEYRREGVDYVRSELWAMRDTLRKGETVVEVSAHEVTPDNSLRHGRYHKLRLDKTVADVNDGTDGKGE